MRLGLLVATSFRCAVADRDDEARRGGALSDISPVVWLCRRPAPLTLSNTAGSARSPARCEHGVDRAGGVALQRLDLLGDFLGGVLGLHRERLHFGGDDRETTPGFAGARGLDGGVERQQRGLPRDLRDQMTTLPIAADDSLKRSTLALASRAASLAWSRACRRRRTWVPMPCAEWVNFSAACEKVDAVVWAAVVAAGQRVGAMADGGQRSPRSPRRRRRPNWPRVRAGGSCRQVRVPAVQGFPWPNRFSALAVSVAATAAGGTAPGFVGSTAGAVASGTRFRNKPKAMMSLEG